jgi:hypothetical protein
MDVLVWNMNQRERNWSLFRSGEELDADVHILCEAPRPPRGTNAIGQWRTLGIDVDLPLDKPVKREFSTGIAVRSGEELTWITDARRDRYYKAPLPFKPSRPGTWTAGRVQMDKLAITCVALYGLMDEKSDASVHRSLSELSPIFDHKAYGKYLLLGGDLNILTNPRPDDPVRGRHIAVLDRIRAYGLTSCLDAATEPDRVPLVDSPCRVEGCRHQRTFRKHSKAKGTAYEEDYLFASKGLIRRLWTCEVLDFRPTSDHAPLRATFNV